MKKKIMLAAFAASFLVGLPSNAQEMPPSNIIVNTRCSINEGHTLADVLEVARNMNFDGENAPNLFFLRQPVAVPNAPANGR